MRGGALGLAGLLSLLAVAAGSARANAGQGGQTAGCVVEPTPYHGWAAERLANPWVTLMVVPELGGRLMQVTFASHDYLFVNPVYYGKYFPPSEGAAKGKWFNYGGDKVWPLPEGEQDERHWAGRSDVLDDGVYQLQVLSSGATCAVRLTGPPDEITGLQYSREISIGADSPRIAFHAVMTNITQHPIRWSVQSVSQYDTSDPRDPSRYNHDFWAFTPANPASVFNRQYDSHSGPIDHPSYGVRDGKLFSLHWRYEEGEVGVDSTVGWVAVVDGLSQFAMVERFHFLPGADYPERASVIFYIDGPRLQLDSQGMPEMTSTNIQDRPYYMEAELNSPLVTLAPQESYALDSEWFPTRMSPDLTDVTDAGVVGRRLIAAHESGGVRLSGTFGVFCAGRLIARCYSSQGVLLGTAEVTAVNPREPVRLGRSIAAPPGTARVALHLLDERGADRGALGEVEVKEAASVTGEGSQ